jgi:hypothetical protein
MTDFTKEFDTARADTTDVPRTQPRRAQEGVKMAFDMRDTPNEAFAFISDNAGNAIELIEHETVR